MMGPVTAHYFSEQSGAPLTTHTISVELAGATHSLLSADGVFSGDHLDLGTQVLLKRLPAPRGHVLDLGCGWGPLALAAALGDPDCRVTAVDVNAKARELTTLNAQRVGVGDRVTVAAPDDVDPAERFDQIWSNPPIRIGKPALHELLSTWLPRLTPGGVATMVVGKNLGADSLTSWMRTLDADGVPGGPGPRLGHVEKAASAKGFRVLTVTRAR